MSSSPTLGGRSRGSTGVQKKLHQELDAERRAHPEAEVQLWAEDEARIGLIPIVRRVWALRGQRPLAVGHRRYQWLYVFGFVRPATGEVFWLLFPTVSAAIFQLALELLAKSLGISAHKRVLLVVDGAGWHQAKDLQVPEGMRLVKLPPYSPKLQPAERLWPLLHEPLANQPVLDLVQLETVLHQRCLWLSEETTQIATRVHYHWWPDDTRATP